MNTYVLNSIIVTFVASYKLFTEFEDLMLFLFTLSEYIFILS